MHPNVYQNKSRNCIMWIIFFFPLSVCERLLTLTKRNMPMNMQLSGTVGEKKVNTLRVSFLERCPLHLEWRRIIWMLNKESARCRSACMQRRSLITNTFDNCPKCNEGRGRNRHQAHSAFSVHPESAEGFHSWLWGHAELVASQTQGTYRWTTIPTHSRHFNIIIIFSISRIYIVCYLKGFMGTTVWPWNFLFRFFRVFRGEKKEQNKSLLPQRMLHIFHFHVHEWVVTGHARSHSYRRHFQIMAHKV